MNGDGVLNRGGATPQMDGITPIFIMVGADPTAGAGFQAPPGSIANFGGVYYWKSGAGATAWTIAPFAGSSGAGPLTTKGDIYGFSTLGARIPVGADGTALVADSSQALGVGYSTSIAKAAWSTTYRYFLLDYDGGSDSNPGYIDGAAGATFTPGQTAAAAMKTIEQLYKIVPLLGDGKAFVILQKPRAGGANYLDKDGVTQSSIDTGRWLGYRNFLWRGSTDLSNDAADKVTCGFIVAVSGPGGAGEYTCAAGATTTVVPIAAGTIAAEAGTQYRMRFLATTATVALRNQCRNVVSNVVNTSFTVGNAFPATPAAGDVFVIEGPGVRVDKIIFNVKGSGDIAPAVANLSTQLVGVAATTTAVLGFVMSGFNIGMTGVQQIGATTTTVLGASLGMVRLQVTTSYTSEAGSPTVIGMGARWQCGSTWQADEILNLHCFGAMNLSATNGYNAAVSGSIGSRSYMGGTSNVKGFSATGCRITLSAFSGQAILGDGTTTNAQTRIVSGGSVTPFAIQLIPIPCWRLNFENFGAATHGCIYVKDPIGGAMNIDGCTSDGSATIGVDATQAEGVTFLMGNTIANTITGSAGDIKAGGGGFIAHTDLTSNGFRDQLGNLWMGTAGQTVVLASAITNSSGGALAVGDVVRCSAAGAVSKSDASALSKSKISGIWLTTTANGGIGYMAPPTGAQVRVNVDGSVTAGDELYLSPTTPGTLTKTRPSGTNQLLRAGYAFTTSAGSVRAILTPEVEASVVPLNITTAGGTITSGTTIAVYNAIQTEPWTVAVQPVNNPAAAYVAEWANDTGAAGLSVFLRRENDGTTSVVLKNNTANSVDFNLRVLGWPGG